MMDSMLKSTLSVADLSEKVKVAVRVRPFNKREIDLKTKGVVRMEREQTILDHPTDDKQPKNFTFDHSFYSTESEDPNFASQEEVFEKLGSGVLENAFGGYNACIFAYGQTGSGKSYSMMGTNDQPGIIPRLCNEVFRHIGNTSCASLEYKVEVSYMEIYNERVRDLLDHKKSNKSLKVREHKILGPMVDGLSILAVSSFDQIASLIEEGNKSRTVAATNMNAESSRSHAVFNIIITQILKDLENDFSGEKVSKISLVDLAGSERAGKTGAMGKRLEEGGNINKSLTTLGMVISALAERSAGKKEKFVPYRDSVLTWLLKDNLGGNSRTVMIATISPAADNYEETLSTLRYADRAKKIVNHAVVNEDPNARIIRELREEVETLRMQISQTKKEQTETVELRERLAQSERLVEQMNKSWEERLRETETLNRERQKDLAEIGISIESSGIKVEKDRFYLVNLNADPSLNELLVYYINGTALIGNLDDIDTSRDSGLGISTEGLDEAKDDRTNIILRGLGVMKRHARLTVCEEFGRSRLYVEPLSSEGRVCVNGKQISDRTLLRNGYRLLIGMNHFFRVNCPKVAADMNQSVMDESVMFDYDDAWDEVNRSDGSNPISAAVDQYMEQVTLKHQEDKQAALEQQYEAFERYLQTLTAGGFTPSTPMTPGVGFLPTPIGTPASGLPPFPFPANPRQTVKSKFFYWAHRKEELFAESLKRLKKDVARANALAREANVLSKELATSRRQTTYDVTLQIPAANLRPSMIKAGAFVCEPVIVVRRVGMSGHQLWTVAQLENRLVDMRELYNDRMNGVARESTSCETSPECSPKRGIPLQQSNSDSVMIDPFFESQEHHSLIGVANVFLEVLFHDMKLDYQVPVISQQGEVAGKLHVTIYRVPNEKCDAMLGDSCQDRPEQMLGKVIKCRVRIKRASSLPECLSNFVFCQYSFFNQSEMLVVAPTSSDDQRKGTFMFEHQKDFSVVVTEEFLEYVQDDALSIEVWGHRSGVDTERELVLDAEEKSKSLQARWSEVSRRMSMWCEFRELSDAGQWTPVEVRQQDDVVAGGVHQLRQGQQRRLVVGVSPLTPSGSGLPLSVDSITSVSVGCVVVRDGLTHRPLDSYQEEDLERIRSQWSQALVTRQRYLEKQLDALSGKEHKSELEAERERSLMGQWVALTEERTAVSLPSANSDIPGAPCDWEPPEGVEEHIPVLFLDLNADDMTGELTSDVSAPRVAGLHSILPLENKGSPLMMLPILRYDDNEMSATCSWDSSIHDTQALNAPTASNERVYAIIKVVVRLSHPCSMDLVLRKRVCLNVYKKASLTERIWKKFAGSSGPITRTAVFYDIVAHIPKSSHDMEERSSLAIMAARHSPSTDDSNEDGESAKQLSYIEAYTKSIQAVESMLKLDRLRQEVVIINMLNKKERQQRLSQGLPSQTFRMKRAVSLPNAIASPPNGALLPNGETPRRPPLPLPTDSPMSTSTNSMVTSICSPLTESIYGKLGGIIEETHNNRVEACIPTRSSTVPETLNATGYENLNLSLDARNGNLNASTLSTATSDSSSATTTSSSPREVSLNSSSTDEENRELLICHDIDLMRLNNNAQQQKQKQSQQQRQQLKVGPLDLNMSAM